MRKISAAELLERELYADYTETAKDFYKGKTILVTGAGGSIGSEIVNQLHSLQAKKVVCIDRDEYALYNLDLQLSGTAMLNNDELILADIRDFTRVDEIIKEWSPEVVFHAAAVKHLPLLERSPDAALITNVIGSKNVALASIKNGVEKFVNVSTDKAADPTSILGYSKKIAEMIVAMQKSSSTNLSSVRFGNVFASRGSFIETLRWQIANGKEVTITDEDTTRFFMTIPQAACLVLETALISESGKAYVLEMGDPVKITDIVNRYIKLIGSEDTRVTFTGLRPGEKMHEVLYDESSKMEKTIHPKIFSIETQKAHNSLMDEVERLYSDTVDGQVDNNELSEALFRIACPDKIKERM